ncbi:MAG: peptidoglycan D,D-transpeptidase FtsI family protein [Verrucomicrobiales bacterium]
MPKFLITLGLASLLSVGWVLRAQEPAEEERPAPRAEPAEGPAAEPAADPETDSETEPVDPAVLEEKDIPRALPVEAEIPRAKPVTTDEVEQLRRTREERRRAEDAEILRLKLERIERENRQARERAENPGMDVPATNVPEAIPVDTTGNRVGSLDANRDADDIGDEILIPRAIPIASGSEEPEPEEEKPPVGLSPMDVASMKAPDGPERAPEKSASKLKASWMTRTDARSFTMLIPAPRGQIVDRWGKPLVQNKVANILSVKLPHGDGASDREVVRYARTRIDLANLVLGAEWEVTDKAILSHNENRRWLPLMFSSALTSEQEETIRPHLDKGMILFPTYVRHYPENNLAAHVVGYAGKTRRLPTGPVASGDPLFPEIEGRDGLEISFDADLQGTAGIANYLFDSDGTELDREIARHPVPGSTVVTTLDLEMQQLAETILKNGVKRGAFVVMNVRTGEVLTLASYPAFNPNDFSPSISQTRFDELQNDPNIPLFARAFRGSYPPASTFKVATALAALESGVITEETEFPCPTVMIIDKRPFRNWNKKSEGDMNVIKAIARSCNPFFFKAGLRAGGDELSSMGTRLGFGQKTGIQLLGEEEGFMPSQGNMRERGKNLSGGHLANASIGQGDVAATPLQVCQMMAGIANGRSVPKARLVMQVQDSNNRVIKHFAPEDKSILNIDQLSLDAVRRGMVDVVNASWGTGKAASNNYVTLAGKTGTGQWGPSSEKRYLAWFAGFVPAEDPEYAFAVLYEGDKGETIGGGRIAAPLAGEFFNAVYRKKKEGGELAGYVRAERIPSPPSSSSNTVRSQPTVANAPRVEPAPAPPQEKEKKRRGFFNRLRRGR